MFWGMIKSKARRRDRERREFVDNLVLRIVREAPEPIHTQGIRSGACAVGGVYPHPYYAPSQAEVYESVTQLWVDGHLNQYPPDHFSLKV